MAAKEPIVIKEGDVFVLTRKGKDELFASDTSLSPAEIELLIRANGKSTVAEIRDSARILSRDAVIRTFEALANGGWIEPAPESDAIAVAGFFDVPARKPSASALSKVKAEAAAGKATLDKEGFFVRIAHRPPRPKLAKGATLSVLVVEDEAVLAKFLRQYLEFEGFEVRLAANRAEIVAEITRQPLPGLVLLDVMLPDADGFDVLLKIRQHPVLKSIPVIMLTAKATRPDVLKGLACGANGYVTKPVDADTLIRAVKSVMGMPADPVSKDPWSHAGV